MEKRNFEFYKNEVVNSIYELICRSKKIYNSSIAIRYKKKKSIYEKSYNELFNDSVSCANYLLKINNSDHIAILGSSSYEWIISYLGIVFSGKIVVPLDKDLPVNDLLYCLDKSDSECLIYNEEYSDVISKLKNKLPESFKYINMQEILEANNGDMHILPKTNPDKLSTILFTSGTTGKSKGVMLTQRNIALNVIDGLGAVELDHNKDVILSILPFHHAYEFTCTILGMIYKGIPICISGGLKYISKDLTDFKPTVMFAVPLIVQKFYEKIWIEAKKKNKVFALMVALKICEYFQVLKIDLSALLLRDVLQAFGGHLKTIMCGGAMLDEKLIKQFKTIGINLFQGYGLTECSPLLSVNFDWYHRPKSVGKAVMSCNIKTVDGEIWAKGRAVSSGYYNMPDETSKSFIDGWFKTGDLGYIDDDNFVFLTGRKKNLIILSNGENVAAEELELLVQKLPYVKENVVYGKDNKIISEIFIKENFMAPDEIQQKSDINKINNKLPSYKHVDCFIIRDKPFKKTTTQKIIRNR